MTDTLLQPSRSAGGPPLRPATRRPLEVGLSAALWSACAGLVAVALPVLLVWAADGRSGSGPAAALRTAGQVWVIAHGTALRVPGGTLALTPLGLAVLPLGLLLRAGGHGARMCPVPRLRDAPLLAVAIGLPYGVLTAIVASLCRTPQVQPVPWQALAGGVLVGTLGGLAGILRETGLWRAVGPTLPDRLWRLLVAAGGALAVIAAGGALLAGLVLARHVHRLTALESAFAPGVVGGAALLVLGLLLVPNAVVWGAAWLAGPGFAVGIGTSVGPFGTRLGAVPDLPLLAGLPGPVPSWVGLLAVCIPLVAGGSAGLLVLRRLTRPGWGRAAGEAALVGLPAGAAAALAGWLSGGSVGGLRLTAVGPSPWQLGVAVAAEVAVGAAVTAAGLALRAERHRSAVRP